MPDDREPLGRIVRETWVNWALEQPDVADHASWIVPWDEIPERDREVDMRIGSAVAGDAGARLAEIRQAITTFQAVRVCGPDASDLAEAVRQILDREPAP